jgi:hypothetical protein
MALREIAAKLGVQVEDGPLTQFLGNLEMVKGSLSALGGILVGGVFAAFVKETINAADDLGDTAERIGVTTDELQRFQYALKLTGGEVEGAEKALFLFNKTLGEAAKSGGGPFTELGLSVKDSNGQVKTAMALLPDVADKVAEAGSEAEKTAIATKFFGKSALSLLPLLKRGREGVAELSAEYDDLGLGLSGDMIEAAGKANDALDRMHFTTQALSGAVVGMLLPPLNQLLGWLTKGVAKLTYFAKHTTFLTTAMSILGVVVGARLLPVLLSTLRVFAAMRTTVFGLSVPFLLVVAVIGALYLIFDDLYALMTGGNSVIGTVLDKFGEVGAKAKLVDTLRASWETLKGVWEAIKPALEQIWKSIQEGSTTWIPGLAKAFAAVVKGIVAAVTALTGLIGAIAEVPAAIKSGDWSKVMGNFDKAGDSIFGKQQSFWNPKTGQMESASVGGLFGTSEADWNKQQSQAGIVTQTNQVTVKVDNQINANGLAPNQAGPAVSKGVEAGVKGALANAYHAVATGPDLSGQAATDSAPGVK